VANSDRSPRHTKPTGGPPSARTQRGRRAGLQTTLEMHPSSLILEACVMMTCVGPASTVSSVRDAIRAGKGLEREQKRGERQELMDRDREGEDGTGTWQGRVLSEMDKGRHCAGISSWA
jgi:hypothetical protein